MGVTKTDLFTAQQNQLATWAKVLAHPARIAILHYLLKQNTCVCGSLVDELGLAQATISQHLCPAQLQMGLAQLATPTDVYITHIKPGEIDSVMSEIGAQRSHHRISALATGQILSIAR